MVTESLGLVNRLGAGQRCHCGCGQVIVDAPAHVLGPGLTAIAPPGVGLFGGGGLQPPIHIDQAATQGGAGLSRTGVERVGRLVGHVGIVAQQGAHPGTLFRQKAGVLEVALPVLEIDLLMGDVHIAAQDELTLPAQAQQVRVELGQKTELGLLPLGTGRAAGKVATDDRQLGRRLAPRPVKAQLDIAALGVELARAKADDHIAGLMAGVHPHARIAFLLGKMKMPLQARQLLKLTRHIGRLSLKLLHTHTIRTLFFEPGFKPFARRRADPVEVKAGEFEQGRSP